MVFLAVFSAVWRFYGLPVYHRWVAARPESLSSPFHFEGLVGDRLAHEFVGINRGRSPMTIIGVSTDCGCTTVSRQLTGKTIQPGETFHVPVQIELSEVSDDFVKRVYVQLDSAVTQELVFLCEGVVRPVWIATPSTVKFAPGEDVRTVYLKPSTKRLLRPLSVSVNHSDLSAHLSPEEDKRSWRIDVHWNGRHDSSRLSAYLFVQTESRQFPFMIPVQIP